MNSLHQLNALKREFIAPPAEFSPLPFWFWNDELSAEETIRQIHDFRAKEVDGFVIHPRMGLPKSMPYLSEPYMELVELAVAEADQLGMKVILYDEGMYPSGSACGMVVKENGDYASRGLQVKEYPCTANGEAVQIPVVLLPEENLVSALAVRKLSGVEIDAESSLVLHPEQDGIRFAPPDSRDWSVLLFIETPSKGTVRGVHPGQDDGESDAPLAADLLNPDAVQTFIRLTHETYYKKLRRFFGSTVIAMFTDEPDLLGRSHLNGLKPWTQGFMDEYIESGCREQDLAALWFEAGETTATIREAYETVIRNRLARTYYKALADWCEAHGIGLTGHPAASNDIGLLEHFHIPGQDVVWRYVAPEAGKAVTGVHSTMGKCSSDSARHRGKRRNMNESFGVCGIEGGWSLSADNIKWYLDWLFVRGVNLIVPHAFYYSIRRERRDERPPDVGPNNIWWQDYAQFARYMKRMSWLMTDSRNGAETAVIAGDAELPWRIVKPLYERQIEFNYLEESLLGGSIECKDGVLSIAGYRYKAVLVENGKRLTPDSWRMLRTFADQGGLVIELSDDIQTTNDIGQVRVGGEEEIPELLLRRLGQKVQLEPAVDSIRISRITKRGILFYVIVNEGEAGYEGTLAMNHSGYTEYWLPWTGEVRRARVEQAEEGQRLRVRVERRECVIIAVDPNMEQGGMDCEPGEAVEIADLCAHWRVVEGLGRNVELPTLSSWTEWDGLKHYSGTVTYEKSFELSDPSAWAEVKLDLGEAPDLARLWVNDREAGVRMWSPYVFDIGGYLKPGVNVLKVAVTNSLANQYDGKSYASGLIGPVQLNGVRK
ncbi:glycosylhydrolase-like jelly roll fold domain-containing protein [Paenibacillus sp. YIM B09110]|uniref:glycosylhydrolase-like jelly roll fold domain-containing protein n=1 Tax=Paenibacillus sp. YIM B09110 TaxID=3126102 RepID=UPI00301BFB49